MNLLCNKLPSNGHGCTLDIVQLKPLTYKELTDYSKFKSEGELNEFIHDFETFILTIPEWESLSSFDTFALICTRKLLTINLDASFKIGDERFTLQDVNFTDIDKKALSIIEVTLGGKVYKPSIKNMKNFYKTVKNFEGYTQDLKYPVVASFIGEENPEVILNLTTKDIVICEKLYSKLLSQPMIEVGGAEAVLFGKASDLFRSVIELSEVDDGDIKFSEVL